MSYINLVCFFSTKTMRITKIYFGHCVGKYDPSTELPRDFCAGIGPLQLGVVLVLTRFKIIGHRLKTKQWTSKTDVHVSVCGRAIVCVCVSFYWTDSFLMIGWIKKKNLNETMNGCRLFSLPLSVCIHAFLFEGYKSQPFRFCEFQRHVSLFVLPT